MSTKQFTDFFEDLLEVGDYVIYAQGNSSSTVQLRIIESISDKSVSLKTLVEVSYSGAPRKPYWDNKPGNVKNSRRLVKVPKEKAVAMIKKINKGELQ